MLTETSLLVDESQDQTNCCRNCLSKIRSSKLTASSILILATCFTSFLLVTMTSSVLSPYLPGVASSKGISMTVTGMIFGVFELVTFVFSPFVVFIIAKLGNKVVFVGGLVASCICSVLLAFLEYCPNGVFFAVFSFILRAASAVGASVFFVASFATLALSFPERISTVNGVTETGVAIGYTLGPGLGGVLFDLGGFKLPLLSVFCLLLLMTFVVIAVIPTVEDDGHEKPVSFVSFLRLPFVIVILLTYCVVGALEGIIEVVMEPFVSKTFKLSHSLIGLMLLINCMTFGLSAIGVGYLSDYVKWSAAGIIFFGIICCALGSCLIDPPSFIIPVRFGLISLVAALIFVGIGVSASLVPIYGLCLDEVCKHGFKENSATINLISSLTNSGTNIGWIFVRDYRSADIVVNIFWGTFVIVCFVPLYVSNQQANCTKERLDRRNS